MPQLWHRERERDLGEVEMSEAAAFSGITVCVLKVCPLHREHVLFFRFQNVVFNKWNILQRKLACNQAENAIDLFLAHRSRDLIGQVVDVQVQALLEIEK